MAAATTARAIVARPEASRVGAAPIAATSGPPSAVPAGAAGTVNRPLAAASAASPPRGLARWMIVCLSGWNGP
jgi:hypothetical protein